MGIGSQIHLTHSMHSCVLDIVLVSLRLNSVYCRVSRRSAASYTGTRLHRVNVMQDTHHIAIVCTL
jgi:hypothetical protein